MYARESIHAAARRGALLIAFVGLLTPLFSGCDQTPEIVAEQPIPKVTTTPVIERETIDYDEYTGRTEAFEIVEIHARVFGYLEEINFRDGDYVKEGQTLFTIESDEYEAIHNQSLAKITVWESKLELAKAEMARREKLLPTGSITQEEYDEYVATANEAEATLGAAKADANRTAVDLKYTVIKAPISGRVDRAYLSKGNLLSGGATSGTLLTKIVNEQPMYVYFDVDERSLLRYRREMSKRGNTTSGSLRDSEIRCFVKLADEDSFAHEGVLDFAGTEVKTSTGTAQLRAEFPNKDRELVSGLFVRVRIPASEPYQALLIPERALATDQDIKFVYVVGDDGIAKRRNVELGAQRGDMRIITAGLKPGEQVIVKGLQRVRPDQKVEAEIEPPKEVADASIETSSNSNTPSDETPKAAEEQ